MLLAFFGMSADIVFDITILLALVTFGVFGYIIYLNSFLPSAKNFNLTSNKTAEIKNAKIEKGMLLTDKEKHEIKSTPLFLKDKYFNRYYLLFFTGFGNRETINTPPVKYTKEETEKIKKNVVRTGEDTDKIINEALEPNIVKQKQKFTASNLYNFLNEHMINDLITAGTKDELWSKNKFIIILALAAGVAIGLMIAPYIIGHETIIEKCVNATATGITNVMP